MGRKKEKRQTERVRVKPKWRERERERDKVGAVDNEGERWRKKAGRKMDRM